LVTRRLSSGLSLKGRAVLKYEFFVVLKRITAVNARSCIVGLINRHKKRQVPIKETWRFHSGLEF